MTGHWLTGARADGRYRQRPWRSLAYALVHGPVTTTSLMTVMVMLALVPPARGQGDPSAGETLRGLTGVNVVVTCRWSPTRSRLA